jgi:phage terminase large subunit-like protein
VAVAQAERSLVAAGERVTEYARAVVEGRVVAGELLRLACERHLRDLETGHERGLRWDPEEAGWGILFFPTLLRHYKGEWGPRAGLPGRPVDLLDWEAFVVGSLDGWWMRNPDPTSSVEWVRRFTTAYVEVAKKNGKTLLAAGIALRRTFFDGEPGAEGYAVATKRDQARLVWSDADALVAASPALRARIERSARSLYQTATRSKFAPLSAEEHTEEGINPYVAVVDELHRHRDRGMIGMIENSVGARLAPLVLIITTAGEPGENAWSTERRLAENILRGLVENDRYFAAVWAIDPDDDPFDEACWPKANPSLPITPKLADLRQRAAEAKASPAKLNDFARLRLNRPMSRTSRFFDPTAWSTPEASAPLVPADGAPAWAGLDLGWSRDLSAFALWVPRDGAFEIVVRAWAPEAAARRRGDGLYERWAAEGWLTLTDGDVRDDDVLEAEIVELCRLYDVRRCKYDRAMASGLIPRLLAAGIPCEPIGQGWLSLSGPMKELDRLALSGQIRHGGNPLLLWSVANTDAKTDDNGNVRPSKPSTTSPEKIDPVSALLNAVAGWLGDRGEVDEVAEPWVIVR